MEQNGRPRQPVPVPNIRTTPGYIIFLDTLLGQGATSKVFEGRHKNSRKRVACKVPHISSRFRMGTDMERESQVLLGLRNKNIVCLVAIEEDEMSKEKILIMELCTGGSLLDVLGKPENSCGLAEKDFLQAHADITAGMKYLRDNGVVHRDVKPGNIMCFKDDHGHTIYKLADFGAARQLTDDENFTSLHGTEEYLNPRVFRKAVLKEPASLPFDARIDLWSIGATLYHLATGGLPFRPYGGRKNPKMMYHLTKKKAPGVISGVQTGPGSQEITWSRELPETCRLSIGLKTLITPLLAGLLESNPSTVWSFQHFFQASQAITNKIAVHIFWVSEARHMEIYCSPTDKFAELQEHITSQTNLSATKQFIRYKGETFEPDGALPISQYSITSVDNPIMLHNNRAFNHSVFPGLTPCIPPSYDPHDLHPSLHHPTSLSLPHLVSEDDDASVEVRQPAFEKESMPYLLPQTQGPSYCHTTRSGRQVKIPRKYKDYVVKF